MSLFQLDPRLEGDSHPIGDLPLCRLMLFSETTYPWLVLVPRRAGLTEITDLSVSERHQLMDEIALAMNALKAEFNPLKINVGALGNMVRQLHIHVLGRFEGDPAWPGPVWGKAPPVRYTSEAAAGRIAALSRHFPLSPTTGS